MFFRVIFREMNTHRQVIHKLSTIHVYRAGFVIKTLIARRYAKKSKKIALVFVNRLSTTSIKVRQRTKI